MRRRDVIAMAGGAAAWPLAARGQTAARPPRVGFLSRQPRFSPQAAAFEQRMSELGYQDGKTYVLDYPDVTSGDLEAAAREIVARGADLIFAPGSESTLRAAMVASPTLPIVIASVDYDPLARAYIQSLAKPGGNITGVCFQQIELVEKRLYFTKEAIPGLSSAIVFWDAISADQWRAAESAGARLGVGLHGIDLGAPPFDYEAALGRVPADGAKVLFALTSPFLFADRARLSAFAIANGLALIFPLREVADAGGLLSYGPSLTGMFRRAADYIDRIARGAKPAELPVEQPSKFELVINLQTAKKLGLDLSPTFLARADEVIE